ncbi:DNA cytosine methyltransferase [Nocardioides sp. NPDC006273]|uniref:DNA cytosine methyltransferase n=1 Tax=Nocardioides sp. NPDC006273 TaxID=3155598 RepID=UPI0033BA0F25
MNTATDDHAHDALDDFAGPGGWDEGARLIGMSLFGVDHDKAACQTAIAAGHARETADVTTHESPAWARGRGHVSSPSCTLFSATVTGVGLLVLDTLADGIRDILRGQHPATVRDRTRAAIYPVALAEAQRANAKRRTPWESEKVAEKARSDAKIAALVLEPARRIVELEPEWVALEQVPDVLPLWQVYKHELRNQGWSCFALILNAADYGVAQTRRRAILGAHRTRPIAPPAPTHAEHPQDADLFGDRLHGWISMATALAWSAPEKRHSGSRWVFERPATTIVGSFKPEVVAAPGYRTQESRQNAPGSVTVSVAEAGVLQSFSLDFPWRGSKSKQFEQVGNAIPPLLAAHVLAAITGRTPPSVEPAHTLTPASTVSAA